MCIKRNYIPLYQHFIKGETITLMANSFLYIKSILRIALHINHKISSVINITPLQTSLIPLFMSGDSQPIEFLKVETY